MNGREGDHKDTSQRIKSVLHVFHIIYKSEEKFVFPDFQTAELKSSQS